MLSIAISCMVVCALPGASAPASGAARATLPRPADRDPFKLPPPPAPRSKADARSGWPANRPPGVRGLLVGSLQLEGVVSEDSGREMIAVVTNHTGRAYFLRANEQLYDGAVTRITAEAVYFIERRPDSQGRVEVRSVVKWLNPPPGERP